MTPEDKLLQFETRRHFFSRCGVGVGKIALASLLGEEMLSAAAVNPTAPKAPHFPAKVKNVIYLFTAAAANRRSCRVSSYSNPDRAVLAGERRCGEADFCPRRTRASLSAPVAIRSSTSRAPKVSRPATSSRPWKRFAI